MEAIKNFFKWLLAFIVFLLLCVGFVLLYSFPYSRHRDFSDQQNPEHIELPRAERLARCARAPFAIPTQGWVGVVYGDSILGTFNHSGLDIFGMEGNGVTPVYAAFEGYVTRLPEWLSAVIIRHPTDPLAPGRQIWTYYTHMGDQAGHSYIIDQIPPGTIELPVKQGTLLGYQGDYNGQSWRPIDTHLHFSIVLDDGAGRFLNETDMANTIDPSPYLGMRLNASCADRPPQCRPDFACQPLASQ